MNISLEVVFTIDKDFGISKDNGIPWKFKNNINRFNRLTENQVVIMGINTFISPMPNRFNIVLVSTQTKDFHDIKDCIFIKIEELIDILKLIQNKRFFLICSSDFGIYCYFKQYVNIIRLTHIDNIYDCDVFLPRITNEYNITEYNKIWEREEQCNIQYITYEKNNFYLNFDNMYLNLAKRVLESTSIRCDRTGTGTYSIFGDQISFDIGKYVPLLTTKRIPWKSCIEELLWFIRGDTNAKHLQDKNVNIWNGNSSRKFLDDIGLFHLKEGDCGANYSFQWRFSGQDYKDCNTKYEYFTKYDQINNIVNLLKNDPFSRRIFLSAWNPCDLDKTVLPPCHVSAQFYVDKDMGLSCHMFQRSCDVFLGLPWNIFSYTMLTYILAKKCDLYPKKLIISFGDAHIYSDHIEQIKEQLSRNILSYPVMHINDNIVNKELHEIDIEDFDLIGYFPHKSIKGTMSV
jgi:thymidylate synthase